MDEQLSLFEDPCAKEKAFQMFLMPSLNEVCRNNFLDDDVMRFRLTDSGYWSLLFKKNGMDQELVVFRYRFGSKSQWAEFPRRSRKIIPEEMGIKRKFDEEHGYTKVWLADVEDAKKLKVVIAASLDLAIEASPTEYSCCSRYQECSDAERCVNPYKAIASECRYRLNLKHGRNFYKQKPISESDANGDSQGNNV